MINEDQKGFIARRHIGETRQIYYRLDDTDTYHMPGLL